MLELLLAILLGVSAGMFTGLTPGVHTNTLAAVLVASAALPFSLELAVCALMAMSITHTFISAIPSIFLGAPDASMVLSALPGHRLLLQGRGVEAVMYTVMGGLGTLLWGIVLVVPIGFAIYYAYDLLRPYTFWILLMALCLLFMQERRALLCFLSFGIAGFIGWHTLRLPLEQPLFHLLTGLFGTSLLWCSFSAREDENITAQPAQPSRSFMVTCVATVAGACAAFLPGLGSSQVAILAQKLVRDIGDEGFLVLVGGINTASMFLSLMTLFVIDRARNGSVVALQQLVEVDVWLVGLLFASMLVAGGCAGLVIRPLSQLFLYCISLLGEFRVTVFVFGVLVALSAFFDAWLGLLVLFVSSCLGVLIQRLELPKHYLMGCLLVPTLLYFW